MGDNVTHTAAGRYCHATQPDKCFPLHPPRRLTFMLRLNVPPASVPRFKSNSVVTIVTSLLRLGSSGVSSMDVLLSIKRRASSTQSFAGARNISHSFMSGR